MSDETTLLPCPFCGGEAEISHVRDICRDPQDWYWGKCTSCHISGKHYPTETEAIAAWNTRAAVEFDNWFYLPKPKEVIVQYGEQEIAKTENGYKVRQLVDVIDEAARKWGDELGEYTMKRICEAWNTRAELVRGTCCIVKTPSDSDFSDDWRYRCSECGCNIPVNERDPETGNVINAANYCPNCGRAVKRG